MRIGTWRPRKKTGLEQRPWLEAPRPMSIYAPEEPTDVSDKDSDDQDGDDQRVIIIEM